MLVKDIFKNSNYGDSLFSAGEIIAVGKNITIQTVKSREVAYINCLIRKKEIKLTPEEFVRQLYLYRLINGYGYPIDRIQVEYGVNFGREIKRADIAIMDRTDPKAAYIIVEVKKPKLKDGKEQLKSYTNATGAPIAVWTNGEQISCYNRQYPNYFEQLSDIPKATEKLSDILNERITYEELKQRDKIAKERRSLRDLIVEIEDEVLANAGVDSFEEVFKLIFSKLYDELVGANDPDYYLQFRNSGDTVSELKAKIDEIFKLAKRKWTGIFDDGDEILLSSSHLSICVSTLQDVKLFNNNLDVVDDAFEYLMSKSQKGEKGQYFTPRYVIDMCVKMMNPREGENIIDTAAGSSGFPIHAIFHVWKNIRKELGYPVGEGFTTDRRIEREIAFVRDHVFSIDFDEKTVRVARTLNLIAGDGQSNVIHLNSLDYARWDEIRESRTWRRAYSTVFEKLLEIRPKNIRDRYYENDYSQFSFDLLMANPPFAGDIKESNILARYDLGKNEKGKYHNKVGRDILFIERNLKFLKPGGRMAIVLPQGRFNNSSDKRIREYIADRCRILAIVGLHGNVFKPHTGTKTSVLFVQKWDDELCPKRDEYPVFVATMQKPSKDNSGDKIYVWDKENNEPKLDKHNHLIVDHDLFNHDGMTQDSIAEAFIEFARKENLSFFLPGPLFDADNYKALMSGLEAIEINYSEILSGSKYFRLEAEFFTSKTRVKGYKGEDITFTSDYGTSDALNEDGHGYPVLRLNELLKMFIEPPTKYCDTLTGVEYEKLRLRKNDVIICRTNGNPNLVGKCAIVMEDMPYVFASYCFRIRTNDRILPSVLVAYLSGKYGRMEIDKHSMKGNQTNFSPAKFKDIEVPMLNSDFQAKIDSLFVIAYDLRLEADKSYKTAESYLLKELGLEGFTPTTYAVCFSIKMLSETFGATGRLDAEYYQPKYEEIEGKITANNTTQVKINDGVFIPNNNDYKYIELANIGTCGNITGHTTALFKDLPSRARRIVKKGQIIVSSIEGSLQSCALIADEYDGAICSTGFYIVECTQLNSETLLMLFKSWPVQAMMKRRCSGTILTAISKSELEDMPLPMVDNDVQKRIADYVQQSFDLRQQSGQLLDIAKQAVEIAIEQGEEQALDFIKSNE